MANRLFIIVMVLAAAFCVAAGQPSCWAAKALIVGVEEYANPDHNLKGVRDDVNMLKDVLVRNGTFSEAETKILLDRDASKENVIKTFKEWLVEGTAPGDTVLFYFSGHGIQVWDVNGDETQDGRDEALMCWNSDAGGKPVVREFRGRRGIAFDPKDMRNILLDDEMSGMLAQLKGRNVIFFSDSCHSGSVYKHVNPYFVQNKTLSKPVSYKSVFTPRVGGNVDPTPVTESTNIGADLLVNDLRIASFTASEDSQPAQIVSFDRDPKGIHSVFTWYLVHGLSGRGDLNKDGRVTLGELGRYLQDEVKRDGFAQIPQHVFQPKSLESSIVSSGSTAPGPATPAVPAETVQRPSQVTCALNVDASITSQERSKIQSLLSGNLPFVQWSDDPARVSCLIEGAKTGNTYGLRLSDSTGAYWEPHGSSYLDTALNGLAGDLKAYYVQSNIAALRNHQSRMDMDLSYELKGNTARPPGEVVAGDAVVFRAKTQTPGYLYIFTVDTLGVIHPLHPGPDGRPSPLKPGDTVALGADGSFVVEPPFGRETIFAFLTVTPSDSLASFWKQSDIGDPNSPRITQQDQFLDAVWKELTSSGKPRGEWVSKIWALKSFKSAKE